MPLNKLYYYCIQGVEENVITYQSNEKVYSKCLDSEISLKL